MTVHRSHLSTEYVRYPVKAKVGGVVVDPTADVVQFAFPARGETPSTWFTGAWETDVRGRHFAVCLVGPDGGVFAPDPQMAYDTWIKITDNPEIPARRIDLLVTPPL